MRVLSRHGQTLMPNKVCNVFQRSTVYSHPACKHVLQVVPPKILDLRVNHCVVEPMPPVSKRLIRLFPRT
jgi:hypothetical protein